MLNREGFTKRYAIYLQLIYYSIAISQHLSINLITFC